MGTSIGLNLSDTQKKNPDTWAPTHILTSISTRLCSWQSVSHRISSLGQSEVRTLPWAKATTGHCLAALPTSQSFGLAKTA